MIVTTSKLLTTGVDVPTCKNVVLVRVINSMTEFKQIIGRGTRVRDDYDKFFFNILDYTGSATRLFADPEFDGEPTLISEEEIDDEGEMIPNTYEEEVPVVAEPEMEWEVTPTISDDSEGKRRKYYFDGGHVEIAAHLVYELDTDGKQFRVVKFTDYTAEKVRTLYPSAIELRRRWSTRNNDQRSLPYLKKEGLILRNWPLLPTSLRLIHSICSAILPLMHLFAPDGNVLIGSERRRKTFSTNMALRQGVILNELLDKYADYGTAQFVIPDVLKVPPISQHGNVIEIAAFFGGAEKLKEAVNQLQTLLICCIRGWLNS